MCQNEVPNPLQIGRTGSITEVTLTTQWGRIGLLYPVLVTFTSLSYPSLWVNRDESSMKENSTNSSVDLCHDLELDWGERKHILVYGGDKWEGEVYSAT